MVFYVIELQTNLGQGSAIPFAYAAREDAEEKYHLILQYAAKSEVPKHGAMLVTEDGTVIKKEVYLHLE